MNTGEMIYCLVIVQLSYATLLVLSIHSSIHPFVCSFRKGVENPKLTRTLPRAEVTGMPSFSSKNQWSLLDLGCAVDGHITCQHGVGLFLILARFVPNVT